MPAVYTRNGRIILRNGLPVVGDCCCTEADRARRCVRASIEIVISYGIASVDVWSRCGALPTPSQAATLARNVDDTGVTFDPLPDGVADTSLLLSKDPNKRSARDTVATSARCRQGDEFVSIDRTTGRITIRALVSNLGTLSIAFHPGLSVPKLAEGVDRPTNPEDGYCSYVTLASATFSATVSNCVVRAVAPFASGATFDPGFKGAADPCGSSWSNLAYTDEVWNFALEVARP